MRYENISEEELARKRAYDDKFNELKSKHMKEGYTEFDAEESARATVDYIEKTEGYTMEYSNGKIKAYLGKTMDKFKPVDEKELKEAIRRNINLSEDKDQVRYSKMKEFNEMLNDSDSEMSIEEFLEISSKLAATYAKDKYGVDVEDEGSNIELKNEEIIVDCMVKEIKSTIPPTKWDKLTGDTDKEKIYNYMMIKYLGSDQAILDANEYWKKRR